MGSITDADPQVFATFTLPIYDGEPHSDPSTREYFAPPKPKRTTQRTYPLTDCRKDVLDSSFPDGYIRASAFLSQYGFTAVKHKTAGTPSDFQDAATMQELYYPEVQELVKKVTGCKIVVPVNSTRRGGLPPAEDVFPNRLPGARDNNTDLTKPFHTPKPAFPIRIPHCDYQPNSARVSIRKWQQGLKKIAEQAGVIAHEDAICTDVMAKASDDLVDEKYNDHAAGTLGPRYAAYSIWRPIKTVTKDPLAFASFEDITEKDNIVAEKYDNRIPGFDGSDHLRELVMGKVKDETKDTSEDGLEWRYISELKPDEVLFVKLFDSAALGEGSTEAAGVLHGSPDIGEAGYGEGRENIEVRCFAFW